MNDREIRSRVEYDVDPYLEAHRELQRVMTQRKREWNGLDTYEGLIDENTWQSNDSHLAAAKDQLSRRSCS